MIIKTSPAETPIQTSAAVVTIMLASLTPLETSPAETPIQTQLAQIDDDELEAMLGDAEFLDSLDAF